MEKEEAVKKGEKHFPKKYLLKQYFQRRKLNGTIIKKWIGTRAKQLETKKLQDYSHRVDVWVVPGP